MPHPRFPIPMFSIRRLLSNLSLILIAMSTSALSTEHIQHAETSGFAYTGTYNPNGEGVYRFTVDEKNGALQGKTLVSTLPDAAQLVAGADGQHLYVASEVKDYNGTAHGGIVAYRVDPKDGSLTQLSQMSSEGAGPVYLSLMPNGRHLLVANYISGSIAVFPVNKDGGLEKASSVQQSAGPLGADKPAAAPEGSFAISGHDGPHAHMIAPTPDGKFVFSTDLGLDRIYQWRFDGDNGQLVANDPPWISASSAGAGPRHFVFLPDGKTLILINEEASTLTRYSLNEKGTLSEKQTISSLPENYKGTSFASGLVLSKDGKNLYVANRLHNSIAHVAIEANGQMKPVSYTWTRGDYPRTLTLDEQGTYLYATNQRSDNITRFRVDPNSGELHFVDDYTPVGSPSQMVFLPVKK